MLLKPYERYQQIGPEFDTWNPHSRRRKLTPESCLLILCVMWYVYIHMQIQIHIHTNIYFKKHKS